MAFNINEFQAQISKRGLAKNNLFLVRISLPSSLNYLEENISTRELTFLCKSATVPGINIDFADHQTYGFGMTEKRPTNVRYGDLSMIFMIDSDFATVKFFKKWMQSIVNFNNYDGWSYADTHGKLPYHFAYKEEYAATVELIMYSGNDADRVYHYKFGDAFPIIMGDHELSWENGADVMTMSVGFTFDKFKSDSAELGQVIPPNTGNNGLLTYVAAVNGWTSAINSIRRPTNVQDAINQLTTVNTIFNAL